MRASASSNLACPLAEVGAEILLERDDLGAELLGTQALQVRIARVPLGLPLVGELARLNLAQHFRASPWRRRCRRSDPLARAVKLLPTLPELAGPLGLSH